MKFSGESVDDLMYDVLRYLSKKGSKIDPSKGKCTEIICPRIELTNPQARVSHSETRSTLFSCLGELIWYISGRNDLEFLQHYIPCGYNKSSDDGSTLYGAYGPRIFTQKLEENHLGLRGQFENVANILRDKKDSRQAVIQITRQDDFRNGTKDVPCTIALQFLLRNGRLNLISYMRSSDVFIGFPHDVFNFTMFQEIMARTVSAELGSYFHIAGSVHLYEENEPRAKKYLKEGVQGINAMPTMPSGSPWDSIKWLVDIESKIRTNPSINLLDCGVDPYWQDLARILKAQVLYKDDNLNGLEALENEMVSKFYGAFIRTREYRIEKKVGVQ